MFENNVKLDAQRQYMVISTLALLLIFCVIFYVSRAAAPEGIVFCLMTLKI